MAVTSLNNLLLLQVTKHNKGEIKMLYDLENQFSDNQAITADTSSTNIVELASGQLKEVAYGTPIPLRIQVTEDFAGLTSLEIKVQTSSDEAFTSPIVLATTGAISVADLKAGYVAPINFIPKGNLGFMRLYYDVTGTGTAGKITAGIVAGNEGSYQNM